MFSFAENKFMSEIRLKQPEILYSACDSFSKIKTRVQKLKETGELRYI